MSTSREIGAWWASNPQTYGDVHGAPVFEGQAFEPGTPEFFEESDRVFLDWMRPLHDKAPFDRLFPYSDVPTDARILEVGCGLGKMLECWTRHGHRVTGVDLNPTSIELTTKRLQMAGLTANLLQADSRNLPLEDASFDYAYSWGVLHHSPDLQRSIAELARVVKPGGAIGVMLYNRQSIRHWYMTRYVEGFVHGESEWLGPLQLASRYTDGHRHEGNPHTWPVTRKELRGLLAPFVVDPTVRTFGTDLEFLFNYLVPGIGAKIPRRVLKAWARRFGWLLWGTGRRR